MNQTKYSKIYDSEWSKQIWKYDLSITKNGPVSVSITHKDNSPMKSKMTIGDYAKLAKKKSK